MQTSTRKYQGTPLLLSADTLLRDADFNFLQDLPPAHSVTTATDCSVVLDWSALTWTPQGIYGVAVKKSMKNTGPNNVDELKAAIKAN